MSARIVKETNYRVECELCYPGGTGEFERGRMDAFREAQNELRRHTSSPGHQSRKREKFWSYRADAAVRFESWGRAREVAAATLVGSEDQPPRPARVALAPESR